MILATLALALATLLGPETPVGSLSLEPAAGNQTLRSVATNGRDFLALWSDERGSTHSYQPALFAGRIDAAGRPQEPTGHRVASDTLGGSLYWNGSSYLLLYTVASGASYLQPLDDDGRPAGAATRMDLAVAPRSFATNGRNLLALLYSGQVWLLSLDGTVLWKELMAPPLDASEIAVLPNGDYRFVTLGNSQVIVATVDGTTGFMTTRTLFSASRMGALVRGATTLVAWTEGNAAKYEIVDAGPAVQFASDAGDASVSVGWDGDEYVVTLASSSGLRVWRVAADGRLLDATPISTPGPADNVHFATTGAEMLLAWDRFNGTDLDVIDFVWGANATNVVTNSANVQLFPLVAEGGLVFWHEAGAVMAQAGRGAAHTIVTTEVFVRAARGASSYLVTWIYDSKIWAKRVAFDGTPIDADPLFLADAGNVAFGRGEEVAPVAFDGTNYLVVWPDILGNLHAVRVAQSGQPLDAAPIDLTNLTGSRFAISPRVVWNGTNFVVAWADQFYSNVLHPVPPDPARISVVRVAASGAVLDAQPTVLWDKSNAYSVGLATNGSGGVEIVWMAASSIGSRNLCVYSGGGTEVACAELGLYSAPPFDLDLAWDGSEYVAAWTDPSTAFVNVLRLGVDSEPAHIDGASQVSIAATTIAYVRIAGEPPYGSVPRVFTRTLLLPRHRAAR